MSTIRTIIKIAAVCFTAPATYLVASSLYNQPLLKFLAAAAGLVLVEGVMLLGWQELDTNRLATPGQRSLYALLAVSAYFVLWAIAIKHGEGGIGIAFRATLGVALAASVWESGILAGLKLSERVERDITKDRKVRKYRHEAEVYVAKMEIDAWKTVRKQAIESGAKLPVKPELPAATDRPIVPPPVRSSGVSRGKLDKVDKALLRYYGDHPLASTREAGNVVGRSHTAVNARLAKLESAGAIHRNGNGVEVNQ